MTETSKAMGDDRVSLEPKVRFPLDEQTIDALELTLEHLRRAPMRPISWKWALIGLHAALQGCFGLVLRRTDGAQLLTKKQELAAYQRWNRERETGILEEPEEPYVDQFLELFEKVQDPERMSDLGGVPLAPTAQQSESMEWLNLHRGKLIHFGDGTLLLTVREMLRLTADSVAVIEFLLLKVQRPVLAPSELAEQAAGLIEALNREHDSIAKRIGIGERVRD